MFNCSSSSIPVTTWCVCMYYAMYCGGALIKNHGPCSGRGWTRSRWSLSCSPAAAPTQVTTVSRSDSLLTLASISYGSWHCWQVRDKCVTTTMVTLLPFCLCMEVAGGQMVSSPSPCADLTAPTNNVLVSCCSMATVLLRMRWWNVGRCLFTCWHQVTSHLGHSE